MTEEKKKKTAAKKPAVKKEIAEKPEKKAASPKKEKKARVKKEKGIKGGKRYIAARKNVDSAKVYSLNEAVEAVKKNATAKFDETVDIVLNLGIDASQTDQLIRGVVPMPSGLGKKVRVAVFAKGAKATEAEKAGADIVGGEELAAKVEKGNVDFDLCIATPDMMALVGKLGKVLGPKGLMPNPKLGSVTMNVEGAVKAAKSGQVEFRTDKAGIVHAGIGKASFEVKALADNVKALVKAVNSAKPSGIKGVYLKSAVLSSSMGPGVKLDLASVA